MNRDLRFKPKEVASLAQTESIRVQILYIPLTPGEVQVTLSPKGFLIRSVDLVYGC